jgi:hypothetical protein
VSKRKAHRKFRRWVRYFRHYEPWHMATPGMERAYDACVRADYARLNLRLRDDGADWRVGWQQSPWADPAYPHVKRDIQQAMGAS